VGGNQRICYLWRRGEHPTELVARRGVHERRRRAEGDDALSPVRWRPAHGYIRQFVGFVRVLAFQLDAQMFQPQVGPSLQLLQGQPWARDQGGLLEEDLCGSSDAIDVVT
jgi:hypothetical protein